MAQFKNAYASHEHSLDILNLLYSYDSFLDSISVIADMGCGVGFDAEWWAKLTTRDDPPEPRNYTVYAVDQNTDQIDSNILAGCTNIIPIKGNFEQRIIPRQVDLMWSHDSFQYAVDPLQCLGVWKQTLNVNGMLVMAIPQSTYVKHNSLHIEHHDRQLYNYNILNLIYMLAITGFDCKDAYFYRVQDSPWLYAAVYATDHTYTPGLSWYELAERGLVNDSLTNSINRYGYAKLEDLVVTWLDKDYYKIKN